MNWKKLELFKKKPEKRFSESIAQMTMVAINKYEEEKRLDPRVPEHWAINRALSFALEKSIIHFDLRVTFSRGMLQQITEEQRRDVIKNEKELLAHRIGEEIMRAELLEYQSWESYREQFLSVNVGIFQFNS